MWQRLLYYICVGSKIFLKGVDLKMINAVTRDALVNEFQTGVTNMFEDVKGNYNIAEAMSSNSIDDVRAIVKKVQSLMIANIPQGRNAPKASLYISSSGVDEINVINITVANKISSSKSFSYQTSITKGKTIEKIVDFMKDVYTALLIDDLVCENLERVNEVLAEAVKDAGLSYGIRVVSTLGNDNKKIASMTDDEIVFVADPERVFTLDTIIVLLDEVDEVITEDVITSHYNSLVDDISQAQTPEQLVGIHGGALISYICDISKRLKPLTLIKRICSKNIEKLRGSKDAVAYYLEDDVFALVERRDGNFAVVLSPFDVKTLRRVDVDVLKGIA
jgi:hypothetical protein